jgi:hypothetical protein
MRRLTALLILAGAACASSAQAAEPPLTVSKAALASALKCSAGVSHATRTPVMLVTGTGASGDEAYAIGKPAFDQSGTPVCWVNFPHHTTGDVQIAVQYLVAGLRTMSTRAGRPIVVFGISQGALLPRIALTYWPSLRAKVSHVVAVSGTQHGTTVASFSNCARKKLSCAPALFQQSAGSALLRALNDGKRDETPGPTLWTTVRTSSDETVRPANGAHPSAALKGATNVLIQSVCPGRTVTHIGSVLDSVTNAVLQDALTHNGPTKLSRLPADVCSHPYAVGLDEATTTNVIAAAGPLTEGRNKSEPKVAHEPALRPWVKRASAATRGGTHA